MPSCISTYNSKPTFQTSSSFVSAELGPRKICRALQSLVGRRRLAFVLPWVVEHVIHDPSHLSGEECRVEFKAYWIFKTHTRRILISPKFPKEKGIKSWQEINSPSDQYWKHGGDKRRSQVSISSYALKILKVHYYTRHICRQSDIESHSPTEVVGDVVEG